MPEHHRTTFIDGALVDTRIQYDYTPGDPGNYTGPPETHYEGSVEIWEFTGLKLEVYGVWRNCDALLGVLDEDQLVEKIKAGWNE